jgi:hypothetical protein
VKTKIGRSSLNGGVSRESLPRLDWLGIGTLWGNGEEAFGRLRRLLGVRGIQPRGSVGVVGERVDSLRRVGSGQRSQCRRGGQR